MAKAVKIAGMKGGAVPWLLGAVAVGGGAFALWKIFGKKQELPPEPGTYGSDYGYGNGYSEPTGPATYVPPVTYEPPQVGGGADLVVQDHGGSVSVIADQGPPVVTVGADSLTTGGSGTTPTGNGGGTTTPGGGASDLTVIVGGDTGLTQGTLGTGDTRPNWASVKLDFADLTQVMTAMGILARVRPAIAEAFKIYMQGVAQAFQAIKILTSPNSEHGVLGSAQDLLRQASRLFADANRAAARAKIAAERDAALLFMRVATGKLSEYLERIKHPQSTATKANADRFQREWKADLARLQQMVAAAVAAYKKWEAEQKAKESQQGASSTATVTGGTITLGAGGGSGGNVSTQANKLQSSVLSNSMTQVTGGAMATMQGSGGSVSLVNGTTPVVSATAQKKAQIQEGRSATVTTSTPVPTTSTVTPSSKTVDVINSQKNGTMLVQQGAPMPSSAMSSTTTRVAPLMSTGPLKPQTPSALSPMAPSAQRAPASGTPYITQQAMAAAARQGVQRVAPQTASPKNTSPLGLGTPQRVAPTGTRAPAPATRTVTPAQKPASVATRPVVTAPPKVVVPFKGTASNATAQALKAAATSKTVAANVAVANRALAGMRQWVR